MNTMFSLIDIAFSLLSVVFMLRMWFQYCHVDFYNPISQRIVQFTQPVLNPLQKCIPTVKNINLAAIFVVLLLSIIRVSFLQFSLVGKLSFPSYSELLIALFSCLKVFGKIIFYSLFISAIGSWFGGNRSNLGQILDQITAPFLNPIRRIMPRTGMIDFSPMILAFILMFANRFLFESFNFLWAIA